MACTLRNIKPQISSNLKLKPGAKPQRNPTYLQRDLLKAKEKLVAQLPEEKAEKLEEAMEQAIEDIKEDIEDFVMPEEPADEAFVLDVENKHEEPAEVFVPQPEEELEESQPEKKSYFKSSKSNGAKKGGLKKK